MDELSSQVLLRMALPPPPVFCNCRIERSCGLWKSFGICSCVSADDKGDVGGVFCKLPMFLWKSAQLAGNKTVSCGMGIHRARIKGHSCEQSRTLWRGTRKRKVPCEVGAKWCPTVMKGLNI